MVPLIIRSSSPLLVLASPTEGLWSRFPQSLLEEGVSQLPAGQISQLLVASLVPISLAQLELPGVEGQVLVPGTQMPGGPLGCIKALGNPQWLGRLLQGPATQGSADRLFWHGLMIWVYFSVQGHQHSVPVLKLFRHSSNATGLAEFRIKGFFRVVEEDRLWPVSQVSATL